MIIFGLYIIANGHISPGGGFQGGAVLSCVFICRYLVVPEQDGRLFGMQATEKLLYVLLILLFTFFLIIGISNIFPGYDSAFLIAANFLIGFKVCCGLSIVFFRFVFYESG